jgi:hypothetical protein
MNMPVIAGVRIRGALGGADSETLGRVWSGTGLPVRMVPGTDAAGSYWDCRLPDDAIRAWMPDWDTSGVARALGLDPDRDTDDLEAEILATLLASPIQFEYPSVAEFCAAVRVRRRVVQAARRTVVDFDTEGAERPDCWTWTEPTGFILRPGFDLIPSLELTLWPDVSGRRHSFSCYRATEYVLLLAIAQELQVCNPAALQDLQQQWQTRALLGEDFQAAFLREYGSLQAPLPFGYYVPGDRLWFRNPDPVSADIEGFEGSWIFYIGGGRFVNFWKPDAHYTLRNKCVELYHWRHGVRHDGARIWMDESIVEARAAESLRHPEEVRQILDRMMRLRDPAGIYAQGGCIDASREAVRHLCPESLDLAFPALIRPLAA